MENKNALETTKYWIEIFKKAIDDKEKMRSFWESLDNNMLHQAELDGMKSKLKDLEDSIY